jgi:hypothetical protein
MKKTYINPEMVIVKIATQQMLASSGPAMFDGTGGGEITLDPTVDIDPVNDEVLGREDDFDFDEDDEF